jgi:DNA polymerase III delta prime subunit
MNGEEGSRPNPDPTLLTTAQLLREIATLKEHMNSETSALRAILDARMDGMDRVIQSLQRESARSQEKTDATVDHLKVLHEEKFKSIQTQFVERDTRTEQTAKDSKVAVDAALQAAKEAVGEQNKSSALAIAKSEAATTKQIDLLGETIGTQTKNLNDKIDDLKERLGNIESRKLGGAEAHAAGITNAQLAVAVFSVLVGIAAVVISVRTGGSDSKPPQVLVVPQASQPVQPSTTTTTRSQP